MEVAKCVAVLIVTSLLFITAARSQLFEGEECTHRGNKGSCHLLRDCPVALAEIRRGKNPTICSFDGFNPIVCCPDTPITKPPPPVTPPSETKYKPGVKAKEMCVEYSKAVWAFERSPALLLNAKPIKVNLCAQDVKPLIIGGEKAKAAEFPHMALIGFGPKESISWWCGGSLISSNFVLTAGHCLWTKSKGNARWVRLGELNIAETTDNVETQELEVIERILHPDYKPPASYNDIALLRLEKNADFNKFVRPACLHTTLEINSAKVVASGWGLTHWAESKGSDHLMKVSIPIHPTSKCQTAYKAATTTARLRNGIDGDTMVCAGNLTGGRDTCKGDSGGPIQLILEEPYCMYDVIGLTSFGKPACGSADSPAVYTRISHYIEWIEKIVWP